MVEGETYFRRSETLLLVSEEGFWSPVPSAGPGRGKPTEGGAPESEEVSVLVITGDRPTVPEL